MCVEVKSRYYRQYVKNLQLRTSAFYPLHLQISFAKIIRVLPISTSASPQICMSAFYHWRVYTSGTRRLKLNISHREPIDISRREADC